MAAAARRRTHLRDDEIVGEGGHQLRITTLTQAGAYEKVAGMHDKAWRIRLTRYFVRLWRQFGLQHRLFLLVQLVLAVFSVCLWFHLQAPGWAIAVLAAVAAAMSVHADMRGWQKAVWMLLIGFLLIIELRGISKDRAEAQNQAAQERKQAAQDRNEAAQERKEQNTKFENVLLAASAQFNITRDGFSNTSKDVQGVLRTTQQVARLAEKNLESVTGGDSFAFVYPVAFGNSPTEHTLAIHNAGNNTLSGITLKVSLVLYDNGTSRIAYKPLDTYCIPVVPAEDGENIPNGYLRTSGPARYHLQIQAQNGTTTEELYFRPAKNGVGLAYRFTVLAPVHGKRQSGDQLLGGLLYRERKSTDWNEPK